MTEFDEIFYTEYEYEADKGYDFTEFEENEPNDGFDYDGARMHRYDEYRGELTPDIVLVKYERLLRSLAKKYAGNGAEYDDLFQIGQIKLLELVKKFRHNEFLSNILQQRLAAYISYHAKTIRKIEKRNLRAPVELLETVCVVAPFEDWETREKAMFQQAANLLSEEEMKLLRLIYFGASQRTAAAALGKTHTAIQKRLGKIREKLAPLLPWLREQAETPCTYIADETYSA